MKIIKALTLLLLTIFLTSCSDPKAELQAQDNELEAKISSLQKQKTELEVKNSKLKDEEELLILEAFRQRKSQETQNMAFMLQQGFSGITGNSASFSEIAAHVDQESSGVYAGKILDKKIKMLRDERKRNHKEVARISKEIRGLRIERKKVKKRLEELDLQ